jgi:acyl-CoA reductase-like NAD-dependent aldehyde dehydrogenase
VRSSGISKRVPVGVIGAIAPFNFPLNLGVHKIAPAIAAGCPVVLKPASQTPTAKLKLAEILDKTPWPKGALSIVPCSPKIADALVTDSRIALITFTGSPEVGWDMKARAGKKKVILELGSNSGCIVDESADLDYAIPRLVYGSFSYSGQKCIAVQRIFVHEKIYAAFKERFVAAVKKVKSGDPRDPEVLIGPMINESNATRVDTWIEEAKKKGAKVLVGGPRQGNVIPATVLEGVPRDASVSCQEVFGPTVTIDPVPSFDAGLAAVNDSRFGLQAGLFTQNLDHAWKAFDELEVGGIILNDIPTYRIDPMPYGGVKDSGLGREGIRFTLEEMTELRFMVVNKDRK